MCPKSELRERIPNRSARERYLRHYEKRYPK